MILSVVLDALAADMNPHGPARQVVPMDYPVTVLVWPAQVDERRRVWAWGSAIWANTGRTHGAIDTASAIRDDERRALLRSGVTA